MQVGGGGKSEQGAIQDRAYPLVANFVETSGPKNGLNPFRGQGPHCYLGDQASGGGTLEGTLKLCLSPSSPNLPGRKTAHTGPEAQETGEGQLPESMQANPASALTQGCRSGLWSTL